MNDSSHGACLRIVETRRLVLTTWSRTDADALMGILGDDEVMKYIADGKPFTYNRILEFLSWAAAYQQECGFSRWKIVEKATGDLVGSCGFARPHDTDAVELGYLLARRYWGRGFATEAAAAVTDFGFRRLKFREIIAMTDPANVPSQRVLTKIGFEKRGVQTYNGQATLVYWAENPHDQL